MPAALVPNTPTPDMQLPPVTDTGADPSATKVYGGNVFPTSRSELFEAMGQWGREQRFFNPVGVLMQWLRVAFKAQGFVRGNEVQRQHRVYTAQGMLSMWSRTAIRHPEAGVPFILWVHLKLHEDGQARLIVETTPRGKACGLATGELFEFPIREAVADVYPGNWHEYAREACSDCFRKEVSARVLPGTPADVPLKSICAQVTAALCDQMAA